jgi:uncharacterized membrane protein
MKKTGYIMWCIIFISFALAIALFPSMPEKMATHWNTAGEVDGYMPKIYGMFLMPFISLFLLGLFHLLPKIDPLKANIEKFRKYYDWFIVFMILFLLYIYILSLAWNIGARFDMGTMILPAMGLLFYYLGILMENAKRNWFIGIRTPWTLSSDKVWDSTHKIGAKLFKAAGILAFAGIFLGEYALFLVLIPIVLISFCLIVYSYWEYKKTEK